MRMLRVHSDLMGQMSGVRHVCMFGMMPKFIPKSSPRRRCLPLAPSYSRPKVETHSQALPLSEAYYRTGNVLSHAAGERVESQSQ
jgi:hypothetical protein